MSSIVSFMSVPRTKLKFSPNVGTDVQLPSPNKQVTRVTTQELPPKSCGDRDSLAMALQAAKYNGSDPSYTSEPITEAGVSVRELSSRDTSTVSDGRVSLDVTSKSKRKTAKSPEGLLYNQDNPSNFYRRVLNAIN